MYLQYLVKLGPDQRLCPWTPLRTLSPDPRHRRASSPCGHKADALDPPVVDSNFCINHAAALTRPLYIFTFIHHKRGSSDNTRDNKQTNKTQKYLISNSFKRGLYGR